MGLFGKKASSGHTSKPKEKTLYEQSFVQSHSFKGYKRFRVSYYGYSPAEEGLAKFRKAGMDLENAEILLRLTKRNDTVFLDVIVNGCFIGNVPFWNKNDPNLAYIKKTLLKGSIEKAHIRIDYENIVTKKEVIDREKIFLFLKEKN